jgi:hypothetical protein
MDWKMKKLEPSQTTMALKLQTSTAQLKQGQ